MGSGIIPEKWKKLEIQAYQRPKDVRSLLETHVPFSGSPRRHPVDPERVVLVTDPFSTATFYYEFQARHVDYVEELPSLVTLEGKTVSMARLWVKKGSLALRSTPFVVEDTSPAGGDAAGEESSRDQEEENTP